jgi:hypothetical protein
MRLVPRRKRVWRAHAWSTCMAVITRQRYHAIAQLRLPFFGFLVHSTTLSPAPTTSPLHLRPRPASALNMSAAVSSPLRYASHIPYLLTCFLLFNRHIPRPCFRRAFSIVCLCEACGTLALIVSAIERCLLNSTRTLSTGTTADCSTLSLFLTSRQWTQKHSSASLFAPLIMSAPSNFSAHGTTSNAHTPCTTTNDAAMASTLAASNSKTSSSTAPRLSGRNREVEV